ncbi:MAG: lipopolysaccharide heptosyltransferase II [Pseudomonadales bacterium]|jgi:heptosyltransferase-2|nr:lipopolysaccharide heptosyltransferase II [Pseudomonadales bacterium]
MKQILIIGPSWIGDMVMAQSLFRCLRAQDAELAIDVLAPEWCRALLAAMPEVRAALPLPIAHGELALGKRRRLGRELRARGYDQAIVLPNSFKSALLPWFAGIVLRTGWRGEARGLLLNDCRVLDKTRYPLMAQRFAALGYAPGAALPDPLPWPRLQPDVEAARRVCETLHLRTDQPVLVLCPGAEFGPAKQWPQTHYAAVARHYLARGWQVWLLGSRKDALAAERILADVPVDLRAQAHNLCGHTSLEDAVLLLSQAAAVVSNDSGLMHVAAALARPLVVVYGSTSPGFTPPLAERVATLSLALPCSPCFKRECPLQHLNCLRQLGPERVLAALDVLLRAVPGATEQLAG